MICQKCQIDVHEGSQFCANCGTKLVADNAVDFNKPLQKVFWIFVVLLLYIVIINWIEYDINYTNTLIVDTIFAVIIVGMTLFDSKTYVPLIKFPKFDLKLLGLIVFLTPIFAYGVHISVDYLNAELLDMYVPNMLNGYTDSPAPFTIALISVALFPALFEELAFRGIVFHEFSKISRVQGAIIVSAVLFTLLHLSIFSIFWILPMGLLTAWIRFKKETLWYGIILHFLHNGTIVLIEYYNFSDVINFN